MLLARVIFTCLLGYLSIALSNISKTYEYLEKPVLALNPALFTACFTIMFAFMATSRYYTKSSKGILRKEIDSLYKSELLVGLTWAPVFFLMTFRIIAFFWILMLIAFTFKYIAISLKIDKIIAYYMLPAFLIMIYVAYINLVFVIINR